jgi:hypothetical protein
MRNSKRSRQVPTGCNFKATGGCDCANRFMTLRNRIRIAGLAAMVLAAGSGAFAQRNPAPLRRLGQRPIAPRPPKPNVQPNPQERRMLDLPPKWTERLQNMTPEQQDKFLNNNARFRKLPPEQQDQIRQRLQTLNNLTPEQRQALLDRERVWQQMSPEQQKQVRDNLLPAWQNLPPRRRQVLLQKLRNLRGLDDNERSAKLNDEAFLGGLSSDERQMLRDLSNLRVGDQGPPGEF